MEIFKNLMVLMACLSTASSLPTPLHGSATNNPPCDYIVISKSLFSQALSTPDAKQKVFADNTTLVISTGTNHIAASCPMIDYIDTNNLRWPTAIKTGTCNGAGTTCTRNGIPSCTKLKVKVTVWYALGYTPKKQLVCLQKTESFTAGCNCIS